MILQGSFDYSQLHEEIGEFLAKQVFFIGAYPKSGTTWLQVMLNAHPDIACHGEGHFLNRFAPLLERALNEHNKLINRKNTTIFREFAPFPRFARPELDYLLASAMMLLLARTDDVRRVRVIGEKTPDNLNTFPRLQRLFPKAKFIHIVRDGRDCLVSAWFHSYRVNPEGLLRRHGTLDQFVETTAETWAAMVERGLRFGAANKDRCRTLRYEDLVRDPHERMRSLFDFLGVSATNETVSHCTAAGAFESMSGGRTAGTEDRSSFMRQGLPGNWREHFTPKINEAFLAKAGKIMKMLQYPTS
jgi:hypothetical protein